MALIGILEARRFFRCVMCSVRTAARFTERERVPISPLLSPGLRGNCAKTKYHHRKLKPVHIFCLTCGGELNIIEMMFFIMLIEF